MYFLLLLLFAFVGAVFFLFSCLPLEDASERRFDLLFIMVYYGVAGYDVVCSRTSY